MIKRSLLFILPLFILLFVSCENKSINNNGNITNGHKETSIEEVKENKKVVTDNSEYINNKTDGTLYFYVSNSNADGFDIIEEKINDVSNLKAIVEKEIELSSLVPKGTVINSITVDNKIAYVDVNNLFSEDPNTNSSSASVIKIYSIVNVLYYNKVLEVDKVKFLIDGEESETIGIMSNTGFIGYGLIDTSVTKPTYNDKFYSDNDIPKYINERTDGIIYFYKGNKNADGFDIIEEKVASIETLDLKTLVEKSINLSSSIPKGTIVNNVYIENRVAYIDLNAVFFDDPQTNSSAGSLMKTYEIVNLFYYNSFFEVDSVTFLKNGNLNTSIGQMDNKNLTGFKDYN
ncbi:GerMN domain-containing protein [Clostridium sp.]|uniref:GerMN domain-containing protein n=1 Tax=Clostridium sp. TaxID=1506 RepID=UPI0026253129|nr:GerMN domain-containing protein [Clostridium sp.]